MANVKVKLGDQTLAITGGDLNKFADPADLSILFNLAQSDIVQFSDSPLDAIPSDQSSLSAGLTVGQDAKWSLGNEGKVTFGFEAGIEGSLTIRKSGELLRYRLGENEQEERIISIPPGFAFVIINLKVSLGVEGGAEFSSGNFGVSGNLGVELKFNLTNYKCFPLSIKVEDAIRQSFESFTLPFKADGFDALNDNDLIEYEFIGKLGLGFGLSYGLGGTFIGGRSASELIQSFNSPIGGVIAGVNPAFGAKAEFAVSYEHEDAFRVVVGRVKTSALDQINLFLFKMDTSHLTVQFNGSIKLTAGAQFNLQLKLDEVINEAANKLFGNLPPGPRESAIKAFKENLKKSEHKRELEKYVKEANERVAKLLSRVNDQKISLLIMHERITTHTALFNYEFDLNRDEALKQGYARAMAGDFVEAIKTPGVSLLPGSFVEDVFIRRTTIRFFIFDLFKVSDVEEYFMQTAIVYAGEGVFKLRFTTGVRHESGHVGHERHVEIFFTADASTRDFETVNDLDVKMHFLLFDHANRKSTRQTAAALKLLGGESELARLAQSMFDTAEHDASLDVKVSCVIHREAYGRLQSDDFGKNDDRPPELPQTIDRRNWDEFVRATEDVEEQGFLDEGFPDLISSYEAWMLFNRAVTDREESTRPPNRRHSGNLALWPGAWINVDQGRRNFLKIYLEAGRGFMNLCDDLKHLARHVPDTRSDEEYKRLLESLNAMVGQDIKVWFTKTTLVALCRLMEGKAANIKGPAQGEVIGARFDVSFDVVG